MTDDAIRLDDQVVWEKVKMVAKLVESNRGMIWVVLPEGLTLHEAEEAGTLYAPFDDEIDAQEAARVMDVRRRVNN